MKQTQVVEAPPFQFREYPQSLEEHFQGRGYVLRYMSKIDQAASLYSTQGCYPLILSNLPDLEQEKEEHDRLLAELQRHRFMLQPDGTFIRSDIRIYIQSEAEREHFREEANLIALQQGDPETVYEQVEDWNNELTEKLANTNAPKGARIEAADVKPLREHAVGGKEVAASRAGLMEKIAQLAGRGRS